MEFFGREISGPFTIPSGIIATSVQTIKRIADIPQIGILTTKSICKEPREGNREPIVHCICPGTFINAVGLRNPGADKFAEELSKLELPKDKFLLASIFGSTPEEMCYAAEKLYPYADGFELNFSCPHSPGHGTAIGHNRNSVYEFIKAIRERIGKPILAKLSPNLKTEEIAGIAKAAIKAGADGITAINTVGPDIHKIDGCPILTSPVGGSKSGREIRERGIEVIRAIRESVGLSIPIIGIGGISTAIDVEAYRKAGANYFGIGTALAGMTTGRIAEYFAALERDLEKGSNEAERYLVFRESGHKKFLAAEAKPLAEDLTIVTLSGSFGIEPGQFVFVWIPGKGEKPYSLIENSPARIVVQKRGIFSNALAGIGKGDTVYLRGPCGSPVELDGIEEAVLVGGGTGIAALYPIAEELCKRGIVPTSFLGAKDKSHLFYTEEFCKLGRTFFTTDDGSYGVKGFVTDLLEMRLKNSTPNNTVFFNCGPVPMVAKAEEIERRYAPPGQIYSSIETLTRCGYGLCGACATPDGLRRCVDGYFMNPI